MNATIHATSSHGDTLLHDYRLRARRDELRDERAGESGYELAQINAAIGDISRELGDEYEPDYERIYGGA